MDFTHFAKSRKSARGFLDKPVPKQVVDDILDATADSEQLGKTAGKDDAAQKPTAVSVLGLDEAREFAAQLCAAAEKGLQQLGVESSNPLNQLPSFLLDRSF